MPKPVDWKGSDLRSRAEVVGWLKRQGGEIHDPAGLIVGRMRSELSKGRAISQLLADMDADGMIVREVRGRRTMMIKLVDDWDLADPLPSSPAPAALDGVAIPGNVNYEQLADTLLAICVKRATAPVSEDRTELAKLRAEVKSMRSELSTLKGERAELKDALLMARESEAEQRRQADTMRESLSKFQKRAEAKPKRGETPLVERLNPEERRTLKVLMESLPSGK